MKRILTLTIIYLVLNKVAFSQNNNKTFIISGGSFVTSLRNSNGRYLSIEGSLMNNLTFSIKTAFTESEETEGHHAFLGVNWIFAPFSKMDDNIFNTRFYLGIYPISYERYTKGSGDLLYEQAIAPAVFIGYKLIFWSKIVFDMYAGGNIAFSQGGGSQDSIYKNSLAGIGLGFNF